MKTRPIHLLTALAAAAGLSGPSAANVNLALTHTPSNAATVQASAAALNTRSLTSRRLLPSFNFTPPRDRGGLFRHFTLNQRQRRKYNRQRHAAGIKKAFT